MTDDMVDEYYDRNVDNFSTLNWKFGQSVNYSADPRPVSQPGGRLVFHKEKPMIGLRCAENLDTRAKLNDYLVKLCQLYENLKAKREEVDGCHVCINMCGEGLFKTLCHTNYVVECIEMIKITFKIRVFLKSLTSIKYI